MQGLYTLSQFRIQPGINPQPRRQQTQRHFRGAFRYAQDHVGPDDDTRQAKSQDLRHQTTLQRLLSQVAYGCADTQGNTGDFMSRQRHGKGKAKENQHRQLDQSGAPPENAENRLATSDTRKSKTCFSPLTASPRHPWHWVYNPRA